MSTSIDGITTTSATDAYGNAYTTAVSGNDNLENEDFITLMLTELSMQDPTSPVDSSSMLDDQLSLQTLETNLSLSESMESLATSFEQSVLADSASLIGNIIENGDLNDDGELKQYKVSSVHGQDGEITLTAYEITNYFDVYSFDETENTTDSIDSQNEDDSFTITDIDGNTDEISTYGKTYEEFADELNSIDGVSASMVENSSGNYQLTISVEGAGSSISSSGVEFTYTSDNYTQYNDEAETISYNSISAVY